MERSNPNFIEKATREAKNTDNNASYEEEEELSDEVNICSCLSLTFFEGSSDE